MVPRLALYGATSTALAAIVVTSALHTRANFFAAAVTVGKSSGSLMVLANFALFNVICFGIMLKKIFFGQLRSIEYEHLFERLWMFLTESLLALTIFRDDFSAPFAIMYSLLLFLKCFHWITADRVDYVPPPGPPRLFHVRIISILSLLMTLDMLLVSYSIGSVSTSGLSSMVLFSSEFMILLASVLGTTARYTVGVIDLRRARGRVDAPSWEEKSMYLFYIDLAVDFVKLLTYLAFFSVIFLNFGLPLHILRDVYMTFRSFISRCHDLVRYRQATRDMDAQYPNASSEEMEGLADKTCIICREEMVLAGAEGEGQRATDGPNETPKKLACGHIFHFHCLRSWLERQQSCPTCRRDVLRNPTAARRPAPPIPGLAAPAAPGQVPLPPLPNGLQNGNPGQHPAFNAWPFANNRPANAPPLPNHAPTPTQPPAPLTAEETHANAIQTGIWGGPITPGQFFPPALGAGPSRASRIPPRRPSPLSPSTASPLASSVPTISTTTTSGDTEVSLPSASSSSSIHSGNITPFSSNPPQVFSSTGSSKMARTGSSSSSGSTAIVRDDDRSSETEDDSAGVTYQTEEERRKAIAEAAMRRLGLSTSGSGLSPITPSIAPDLKGKGRAVEPDTATTTESAIDVPESLDDPPRHVPYLTSSHSFAPNLAPTVGADVLSAPRRTWSDRPVHPGQGLEDRMKVLQDVDQAIWGLMGELAKARSRWEIEDGDGAGGTVDAATPGIANNPVADADREVSSNISQGGEDIKNQ